MSTCSVRSALVIAVLGGLAVLGGSDPVRNHAYIIINNKVQNSNSIHVRTVECKP